MKAKTIWITAEIARLQETSCALNSAEGFIAELFECFHSPSSANYFSTFARSREFEVTADSWSFPRFCYFGICFKYFKSFEGHCLQSEDHYL